MTWKWKAEGREGGTLVATAAQAKGRAAVEACSLERALISPVPGVPNFEMKWIWVVCYLCFKVTLQKSVQFHGAVQHWAEEVGSAVPSWIGRGWSAASGGSHSLGMHLPVLVPVWDHLLPSLPTMMLGPGAVPKHSREGLVGARWLCPLWVFLSKTGSFVQNRDGTHQQMTQDTGVMKQVTGKQWRSKNYLLCWLLAHQLWVNQVVKGWRSAQVWKRGKNPTCQCFATADCMAGGSQQR